MSKNSLVQKIILVVSATAVFLFAYQPMTNNDTFFGLKIGEIIVKTGKIPTTEVFSWAAYGREIVAYEWLAQTVLYAIRVFWGFRGIEVYVSAMVAVFFLVTVLVLSRGIGRDFMSAVLLSLFLVATLSEFFVSRPHLVALVCFMLLLFIVFRYLKKGEQKILLLLLPLTFIWTNSHASFIFIPYFLFAYAGCGFLYHQRTQNTSYAIRTFKALCSFGFLSILITLLPPLWYKPYLLLIHFINNRDIVTQFIMEWGGLSLYNVTFLIAVAMVIIVFTLSFIFSVRRKQMSHWLLALPLFLPVLASFQAIRHAAFGNSAAIVILSLFLSSFSFRKPLRFFSIVATVILLTLTVGLGLAYKQSRHDSEERFKLRTLAHDMVFLKTHKLTGRMFNEYALGSYLLYYLYPQYQVFFDGRTDVYLCCEMRDFWPILAAKRAGRDELKQKLDTFLTRYQFSYVIFPIRYNPLEFTASGLILDILMDDPSWRMVYFSDYLIILVREDGKNSDLFNTLGMTAITPLRFSPYRLGRQKEAIAEYQRMIAIADSGMAHSRLGQIYIESKMFDFAKKEFEKALRLNPYLENPYLHSLR